MNQDKVKLNLGCGNDIRLGYENIDLFPVNKDVKFGNFKNLSYQDASVQEVLAIDIIKYIPINEISNFFEKIYKVLVLNGTLYIESLDYNLLANSLAYEFTNIMQANQILYPQEKNSVCAIYNLYNIEKLLTQLGFKVVSKFYSENNFCLTVIK